MNSVSSTNYHSLRTKSSMASSVSASSSRGDGMAQPQRGTSRCVKYSPMVRPPKWHPSIESYAFEAKMWRAAFEAMQNQRAPKMKEVDTVVNKDGKSQDPYHCSSNGRQFKVIEGPPSNNIFSNPPPEINSRFSSRKEYDIPHISSIHLPRLAKYVKPFDMPRNLLTGERPEEKIYLPPTAVLLKCGPSVTDNKEQLFEWLDKKFGEISFTMSQGQSRYIVVFEDIKSSHALVNAGIPPKRLDVSWCDIKFYNYGHFNVHSKFKLSKDPKWRRGMEDLKDDGYNIQPFRDSTSSFEYLQLEKRF